VLIRVIASSVNNVDCAIRNGYGRVIFGSMGLAAFPMVPGRDASGVVEAVGPSVTKFQPGDHVFTAPPNRGCAEYVAVHENHVARKPSNLTHVDAASLPFVALTTWAALVGQAGLTANNTKGQRVVISRGAGGVGTFAIQLIKAWGGHVATTTSAKNIEFLKRLGADEVIDYTKQDFVEVLKDFDVAYDLLGYDSEDKLLSVLKRGSGARYVSIVTPMMLLTDKHGLEEGRRLANMELESKKAQQKVLGREYAWSFFQPNGAALAEVASLVERGLIKPVVDRVYPLEEIVAAHEYCETKRARGKIAIRVAPEPR
jgi:NADPH:quinone reductase-like Zn-dependent oxidoreductase